MSFGSRCWPLEKCVVFLLCRWSGGGGCDIARQASELLVGGSAAAQLANQGGLGALVIDGLRSGAPEGKPETKQDGQPKGLLLLVLSSPPPKLSARLDSSDSLFSHTHSLSFSAATALFFFLPLPSPRLDGTSSTATCTFLYSLLLFNCRQRFSDPRYRLRFPFAPISILPCSLSFHSHPISRLLYATF